MFNFDITEYQKTFTEQADKVRGLTEKAFKLNTEFAEAAIARQTQVATELAKTNTEYVKGLVDIENLKSLGSASQDNAEKLVKDGEAYVGEVKDSLTAVYEESVASLKKYQGNLEKVVSQLSEISAVKKTPTKKTAKAS